MISPSVPAGYPLLVLFGDYAPERGQRGASAPRISTTRSFFPSRWRAYRTSGATTIPRTSIRQGFNINDLLKFTDQWLLPRRCQPGLVPPRTTSTTRACARRSTSITCVSPTGSIIFKPAVNMTTYFTYASALQAGDVAPGNRRQRGCRPCPLSQQGILSSATRRALSGIDVTAALFRIERPLREHGSQSPISSRSPACR